MQAQDLPSAYAPRSPARSVLRSAVFLSTISNAYRPDSLPKKNGYGRPSPFRANRRERGSPPRLHIPEPLQTP